MQHWKSPPRGEGRDVVGGVGKGVFCLEARDKISEGEEERRV